MLKKISFLVVILLVLASLVLAFSQYLKAQNLAPSSINSNNKLKVAVSFYPFYDFVRQIGGENLDLVSIVPFGVEPHDFSPSAQDVANIENSDLFIYNGAGFDPWAEKVTLNRTDKAKKVNHFEFSLNLPLIENNQGQDPHIWLDPKLVKEQVQKIKDILVELDAKNENNYKTRSQDFIKKLDQLDQKYQQNLQTCNKKELVVAHDAYEYLAKSYNLQTRSISGLSPQDTPTAQELAAIIDFIKQNQIQYILVENEESSNKLKPIIEQTNAKTLVLSPLETLNQKQLDSNQDYLTIMEENLQTLIKALDCQVEIY